MAPLDTASAHVKAGKLRALGVTTQARSEVVADVPTIAEQGFANYEISLWFGVWAPAETPTAIISQINADINRAFLDPDVKASYARAGIRAKAMTPEEFTTFVKSEMTKYQTIARSARIEPQ